MGRKRIESNDPNAREDVRVLEVPSSIDEPADLPLGCRVTVSFLEWSMDPSPPSVKNLDKILCAPSTGRSFSCIIRGVSLGERGMNEWRVGGGRVVDA
ncbi:MAG TPA: hypothetical protein VMT52_08095 [Planctomycetota bacterium]|nr:hypothetical protein [Planctomycetota bacterium]